MLNINRRIRAKPEELNAIAEGQQFESEGLLLLFAKGKRPTAHAVRQFAEGQRAVSLSYDPSEGTPLHLVSADGETVRPQPAQVRSRFDESVWVELLHNGLTFDLLGLAPGHMCEIPAIEHRFDMDNAPIVSTLEALKIIPGEHLVDGQASLPVVKGMAALARDMVHHFDDIVGVVWEPAKSAIGRRFFESISTAWLEGGAFPALGFTAFRKTSDGALQTVGLNFWIGQEVRIEPPLSDDKVAATRLGIRIVNHLVLIGGLEQAERITGPDRMPLVMRPSRNQKFIRVWRDQ